MKVIPTVIPEVLLIEPEVHRDERGLFLESFNQKHFNQSTGLDVRFVQDNQSRSLRNVLRGLHYQTIRPQGKLVRVVHGAIFDVTVDIRRASKTFGRWVGMELTETDFKQIWIPPGFAHGFLVVSETADVLYKTTEYYLQADEGCIAWDDPLLGIKWPLTELPMLSTKDAQGEAFQLMLSESQNS